MSVPPPQPDPAAPGPGAPLHAEDEPTLQRISVGLERLARGEPGARDELINLACDRLARLTRRLLEGFPGVARWEQTDDVLQNALLRLMRALKEITPGNVRQFFGLAAAQIRRELLDLARHWYGPQGAGARHKSRGPGDDSGTGGAADRVAADDTWDPAALGQWTEFHTRAAALPDEDREIFDLLWYQGLSQEQAATILGVSVRTVKRRWQSARLALYDALGGKLPE